MVEYVAYDKNGVNEFDKFQIICGKISGIFKNTYTKTRTKVLPNTMIVLVLPCQYELRTTIEKNNKLKHTLEKNSMVNRN